MVLLTNITLNKVVPPAGESVYQDAKGQPMPPHRWPTEFHYVHALSMTRALVVCRLCGG